jgi:hypothetical protein
MSATIARALALRAVQETTQLYLGVQNSDKLQPNVDRAFGD